MSIAGCAPKICFSTWVLAPIIAHPIITKDHNLRTALNFSLPWKGGLAAHSGPMGKICYADEEGAARGQCGRHLAF